MIEMGTCDTGIDQQLRAWSTTVVRHARQP